MENIKHNNTVSVDFMEIQSLETPTIRIFDAPIADRIKPLSWSGAGPEIDRTEYNQIVSTLEEAGFNVRNAIYFLGCANTVFFAKDHGFTLRLSYNNDNDFYRRFHGSLTAPIGWGKLSEQVMFYLYPGERLMENYPIEVDRWRDLKRDFKDDVDRMGYNAGDIGTRNMGLVDILGKEMPVMIDTDCLGAREHVIAKNRALFNAYARTGMNPADVYEQVILERTPEVTYQKIALRHQDLRQAFFEAWPGAHDGLVDYDRIKMQKFFDLAHDKVQQGELHPSWNKPTLLQGCK